MIKYNRRKRGTYNAHTQRARHIHINEICGAQGAGTQRIHIRIASHYDGYNRTEYTRAPIRTRDTRTAQYISMTNIIRDIFPEMDAPHTAHTHRATAPYRRQPPIFPYRDMPRYLRESESDHIERDTRTVKCIIYSGDRILYIGMMRRTRVKNKHTGQTQITLRRNDRTMDAYESIPPFSSIHGMSVAEIRAHGVELYEV